MSLPSVANFYKKGKIIGSIGCNCGWWWDEDLCGLLDQIQSDVNRYKIDKLHHVRQRGEQYAVILDGEWDEMEAYGTRMSRIEMANKVELDKLTG